MIVSMFSAISSAVIVSVPMWAWNVIRSLERTLIDFFCLLISVVTSAWGGSGAGILPRGPSTWPNLLPIVGM